VTNIYLRTAITAGAFIVAFILGYNMSADTGTEPGYFGSVDTASYGSAAVVKKIEGISAEDADYYKSLSEE